MNMKRYQRILSVLLACLLLAAFPGISGALAQGADPSAAVTADDLDGDGIPNAAEKILGTNPYAADTDGDGLSDLEDAAPTILDNPVNESSAVPLPVAVKDARVEDNQTADHLEITLRNTGAEPLGGLEIYYTITDKKTGAQEAYYVPPDGLKIATGGSATLHFDNKVESENHYFGNMNGLYGTSANGLIFSVTIHAAGYAPIQFDLEKDAGAAEVAD
jgi:hypothetical protein